MKIFSMVVAFLLAAAGAARASGFETRWRDARGLGLGGAAVALSEDASTVAYNPAGMAGVTTCTAEATVFLHHQKRLFLPDVKIEQEANDERRLTFHGSAFAVAPLGERFRAGIGIFEPFRSDTEWRDPWSGRYISIRTGIESVEVNPSLAYEHVAGEHALSLGVGIGLVRTSTRVKRAIDFSSVSRPDGYVDLAATGGVDVTYDVGLLAALYDRRLRIGLAYRAGIDDVRTDGIARAYRTPSDPVTGAPALPPATRGITELNYPDRLGLGLAIVPLGTLADWLDIPYRGDPLTLTLDVRWTNWSRFRALRTELPAIGRAFEVEFGWRDAYSIAGGAEYAVLPDLLVLRAGGFYEGSPGRWRTDNPAIPATAHYGFGVGARVASRGAFVDLAYGATWVEDLVKDNLAGAGEVVGGSPRANGTIDTFIHEAAITVGLTF